MTDLTGPQRAAVILAQLDGEQAARVLAKLSAPESIALTTEVARLPVLDEKVVTGAVADLVRRLATFADGQGGKEVAERLLRARLGPARAAEIMEDLRDEDEVRPLTFLAAVDPVLLARFLAEEHPQLTALILSHLRKEHAARVLEQLDPVTRTEVARRLVVMSVPSPSALQRVHGELEGRLLAFTRTQGRGAQVDGMTAIVGILTSADQATERQLLTGLEERDPELAVEIRSRLFTFEDLVRLDSRTLQAILRAADPETVAVALKGKPADLVERFASELTERRGEQMREDLASLPPQFSHAVQAAESALVALTLSLSEAGTITLERSDDPLVD